MSDYHSIAERLRRHRILVNNGTNDPVIADRMATVGYTPEKMQEAQTLLEEAEEAAQLNKTEQGEYREALEERQNAKTAFHDAYIRDLQFARIALRNQPETLRKIDASGSRERGQAKYLEQAGNFYNSIAADENLLAALSVFGFTAEKVNDQLAAVNTLYELMEKIEREEGDAQHQITVRDQKLDAFDDWSGTYKQVARLMFDNDAQNLEKLGIIVKS